MRRAVNPPAQDINCNDIRQNYSSMARYDASLKPQIEQTMNSITGITAARIEQLKNSREPQDEEAYLEALNNLTEVEDILYRHIRCINRDIIQRNDYSSRLYTLQQELENLRKEVKEKKQIVSEARERSDQLENPYNKTTWWETWFPLGRPIRKENVPVLLSVSIVMLVFSLGVFLKFAGFELRLDSLQTSTTGFLKNINSGKYPQRV